MSENLKEVLLNCKKSAEKGQRIATCNSDVLKQSITSSQVALNNFKQKVTRSKENSKIPEYCQQYIHDMEDSLNALSLLQCEVDNNLKNEMDRLSVFKLVVYGRTKAGKSTLMETLTNGDGDSIGCGAQRTTKDVREYSWNGLTVYDTPGIASSLSEGREDEAKAFDAAKYGDLLIFLFSDDAPQKEESLAFATLKRMGKPILGIINCKSSDSSRSFSKMRIRDIKKKLTDQRLNCIRDQLLCLASDGDNRWDDVTFIYTDLHTAFLSKLQEPPEIVEHALELFEISRFADVEKAIIESVKKKGSFFQFKTFIDITYHETWEIRNNIRKNYFKTRVVLDALRGSEERLIQVRNQFERDAHSRIDSFIQRLHRELQSLASSFAEINYDNDNASEDWIFLLNQQGIDKQTNDLLEEIAYDCEERINEFAKEFQQSISFRMSNEASNVTGYDVTDYGSCLRIGGAITTIGLGVATLVAGISVPVVGWIALAAVGIFSLFFESKEEKIRKAIKKMREQLNENVDQNISAIRNNAYVFFQTKIMDGYIENVIKYYNQIKQDISEFSEIQNKLSCLLRENLLQMNQQLLAEASLNAGNNYIIANINRIARIPGEGILIEWKQKNNNQSESTEICNNLKNILQETVNVINPLQDNIVGVADVLGISQDAVSYNETEQKMTVDLSSSHKVLEIPCMPTLIEQLLGVNIVVIGHTTPCEMPIKTNLQEVQKNDVNITEKSNSGKLNVDDNTFEELSWYKSGEDYSDAQVQWDIADHYFHGINVKKNYIEAFRWAELAADQRYARAQRFLGDCYYFGLGKEQDYKKAIEWYQIAEECGDIAATKYIGDCYYFGFGVIKNEEIAADYYEKAAENGNAVAMFNLGNAYYLGEGRPVNFDKARRLYQKSAEADISGAQNNLGNCYYLGNGIGMDFKLAYQWYKLANQNGCSEAKENLDNFY